MRSTHDILDFLGFGGKKTRSNFMLDVVLHFERKKDILRHHNSQRKCMNICRAYAQGLKSLLCRLKRCFSLLEARLEHFIQSPVMQNINSASVSWNLEDCWRRRYATFFLLKNEFLNDLNPGKLYLNLEIKQD